MDFTDKKIDEYSALHTSEESVLLKKINRETWSQVIMPRMLSGHVQGRILALFSKMLKPERILEIGTYTGYSALCFAEGLSDNGKLITIDINEELESRVRGYFSESEYNDQITYLIGNAMNIIPELNETFDLVFIDADKINYLNYYNLIFNKLKPGSIVIADNVLWSGKVTMEVEKMDKDTKAIHDFNETIMSDERVEKVMFPVRDGLLVIRVK